jgi:hypothetical protein
MLEDRGKHYKNIWVIDELTLSLIAMKLNALELTFCTEKLMLNVHIAQFSSTCWDPVVYRFLYIASKTRERVRSGL